MDFKTIPSNQCFIGEPMTFEANVAADAKTRPIHLDLYSGGPVGGFFGDMIVDLAGMSVPEGKVPILRGHDSDKLVGNGFATKTASKIDIHGEAFRELPDTVNIEKAVAVGFQFQASMGFSIEKIRFVEDGDSEQINDRTFDGPGLIVSKSTLLEGSVVPLGRDRNTASTLLSADGDRDITIERRKTMTKTGAELVAAFAAEHADQVATWKRESRDEGIKEGHEKGLAEGREAGQKEARQLFAQMATKFGESHMKFSAEQYLSGTDLSTASDAFAAVLQGEAKVKDARIAELEKAGGGEGEGADPVPFGKGSSKEGGSGGGMGKYDGISDVKERAVQMFADNPKLSDGTYVRDNFAHVDNLQALLKRGLVELAA